MINLKAKIDVADNLKMIRSVFGDKRRFLQILLNFLSNALKFTRLGGTVSVLIDIIEVQEIDNDNYVNFRMSVKDTGVGISKENLKNLFIDFSRLSENEEMNKSGTGLGLSICKQIIEQMGGSISVESIEGKGSIFNINFKTKYKIVPMDTDLLGERTTFIKKRGPSLMLESHLHEEVKRDTLIAQKALAEKYGIDNSEPIIRDEHL